MSNLTHSHGQELTQEPQAPVAAGAESVAGMAVPVGPQEGQAPQQGPSTTVATEVAEALAANKDAISKLVAAGSIKATAPLKAALESGDFSGVSAPQGAFILKRLPKDAAPTVDGPSVEAPAPETDRAPAKDLVAPDVAATLAAKHDTVQALASLKVVYNTAAIKSAAGSRDYSQVSAKQADAITKVLDNLSASGLGVEEFVKTLKAETSVAPKTPKVPGYEKPVSPTLQGFAKDMVNGNLGGATAARIEKAFGAGTLDGIRNKLESGEALTFGEYAQVRRANSGARVAEFADRLMGISEGQAPLKNAEGQMKAAAVKLSEGLNEAFKSFSLPAYARLTPEDFKGLKDGMKQDVRSAALVLAGGDRNVRGAQRAEEKNYPFGAFDEAPSPKAALKNAVTVIFSEAREAGVKLTAEDIKAKLPEKFRANLELGCSGLMKVVASTKVRPEGENSPTSKGRVISASAQDTIKEALSANPEMAGWPDAAKDLVNRGVPVSEWTYSVYNDFKSATGLETKKAERPVVPADQERDFGSNSKTFSRLKEMVDANAVDGIPEGTLAKVKDGIATGSIKLTQGEYMEIRSAVYPPAEAQA